MTCRGCERGLEIIRGRRQGTRSEPDRRAGIPSRGLAGSDIPPGFPTTCQCHVQLVPGDPSGGGVPVPCYFDVVSWGGVTGETLTQLVSEQYLPPGGVGGVDAGGGKLHPTCGEWQILFPDLPSFPLQPTYDGANRPTVWQPRVCDASTPVGWTLSAYRFRLEPVISGGVLTEWRFEVLADDGPYAQIVAARYTLAGWDPWTTRADGVLPLAFVDAAVSTWREAYTTDPDSAVAPSFPSAITLRPRCFDSGCLVSGPPGHERDNLNPCATTFGPLSDPGPTVWRTPYTPPESPPVCYWSWVDYDHWEYSFGNCGDFPNASCGPPPVCDGPPSGIVFPVDVGCYSTRP